MKSKLFIALILSFFGTAHAGDLLESLRKLTNTVNEATKTTKELGELKNSIAPAKSTEVQATQQAQPQPSKGTAAGLQPGDVLVGKVANIKFYPDANKTSTPLGQLAKSDELIFMGEEQNGLYKVTAPNGEGWVDKLLVKKN